MWPASTAAARRPLQRHQRALVGDEQLHVRRQARADVGVVGVLAGGIDDQHQRAVGGRLRRARHHQVIEDAAVVGRAIANSAAGPAQVEDVGRNQRLERLAPPWRGRALQEASPMCATSNRPAFSRVHRCSLSTPERVLHGHLVAGERHHLGAGCNMQVIERRALQACRRQRRVMGSVPSQASTSRAECARVKPPLSRDLRELSGLAWAFSAHCNRPAPAVATGTP